MLRRPLLALTLLAAAVPLTPASAQSSLTRIEPRPYYGAVVTVEQGVRVWRPLPPTRHMIINPTNAPVSVNITDVQETINHNGAPINGGVPMPVESNAHSNGNGGYHGPYYFARPFRHPHRHRAGALVNPGRPHAHRPVPGIRRR